MADEIIQLQVKAPPRLSNVGRRTSNLNVIGTITAALYPAESESLYNKLVAFREIHCVWVIVHLIPVVAAGDLTGAACLFGCVYSSDSEHV